LLSFRKVLVTGGAGFIGSHVVDRLVDVGCEVRVVDDLSTGRLDNVREHLRCGRVSFVRGDVRELEVVRRCVQGVDAVVHLAAIVSVPFSVKHPSLTYETNAAGTLNLLSSCLSEGVERFVYVSSCAVYGEPVYLPVDESHPTRPVSPYASSKLEAEGYCEDFRVKHGLGSVVLRLFNVYGPRQGLDDYSGVIRRFVDCVKRELPLVIYGDGCQTRDFVYVSDVVDVILKCLENEKAVGEVFNVGFGEATSINDLAKTVLRLSGLDLDIVYEKPRPGDLRHSFADVSKARKLLGFEPKVSLEDGLRSLLSE